MARYIKANHLVAEFLHVENDRNRVTDGNYLLWQADILAFGKLIDLPEILAQIGGLALMTHEAKEEQDGTVVRPLPVATDPRFIIVPEPEDGNDTENAEGAEADAENSNESNESNEDVSEETSEANETNEDGEENNGAEPENNSPSEEINEAQPEINEGSEETNQDND